MSDDKFKGARIYVPAVPVAQPRQRTAVRNGFATNYTPKDHPVNAFKAAVAMAAREAYTDSPMEGPVWLMITCVFPRPKGMVWKTKPMPRVPHTKKPDRDNVEKAVMDALSGIVWRDDSQVYDGPVSKFVASGDESPHVEIVVLEKLLPAGEPA